MPEPDSKSPYEDHSDPRAVNLTADMARPTDERTGADGSRDTVRSPTRSSPEMPSVESGKPRARRGFAAMNPERRREIARKGGEASRGGGRTRGRES